MVSFVALLAGVGSGHAAIPSTDYVDQGLETKVDDTQIMPAADSAEVATYAGTVQSTGETEAYADTLVPSLNAVAQSFVPSVPTEYVNTAGGEYSETGTGKPVAGSYVLTADVDDDGNVKYRWIGYGHTID